MLHQLRTREIRKLPRHAKTFLSAGCSGGWYFDWIDENYGHVDRHIGLEYYSPKPVTLPSNVEWIQNTVSNMEGVEDGSVDLSFSGQNIEHLWPDEICGSLLETHRTLKAGGMAVLDSPNRRITAQYGWSHPEHTIELTVDEISELLEICGFDVTGARGLWLCYDSQRKELLPLAFKRFHPRWPALRRVAAAASRPDDSFLWWVEARKNGRKPDPHRLKRRVNEIYAIAWPERIQRLQTQIGKKRVVGGKNVFRSRKAGALMFGPFMPLHPGRYVVVFELAANTRGVPPDDVVCECDVLLSSKEEALVRKRVTAKEFQTRSANRLDVDLPFELDALEFGVQYRVITTGRTKVEACAGVRLHESKVNVAPGQLDVEPATLTDA